MLLLVGAAGGSVAMMLLRRVRSSAPSRHADLELASMAPASEAEPLLTQEERRKAEGRASPDADVGRPKVRAAVCGWATAPLRWCYTREHGPEFRGAMLGEVLWASLQGF